MMWVDDGGRIKAAVNDSEEYTRLLTPLKRVPVLYIDDFFKADRTKGVTPGDIKMAFELLNYRYINEGLVTIISTEKSIESILSIDEAIGSRIYQKSKDYCLVFEGEGKNWRLRASDT